MLIYVTTWTGKIIRLYEVNNTDTVDDIKLTLEALEGFPPERLFFDGKQLESGRTLQDYNIQNENTLWIILRLPGGGYTFNPARNLVHVPNPTITIDVTVSTREWVYYFKVGSPFTIDSLMGMIQTAQGIPIDRQILEFNSVQLKEFNTLMDYGIRNGDTIILTERRSWIRKRIGQQIRKIGESPISHERLTAAANPLKRSEICEFNAPSPAFLYPHASRRSVNEINAVISAL